MNAAAEVTRTDETERIISAIKSALIADDEDGYSSREDKARLVAKLELVRTRLLTYSDRLIAKVLESLTGPSTVSSRDLMALTTTSDIDANTVHEFLVFRPYLDEKIYRGAVLKAIKGIHTYAQLPVADNYAEADDDVQEKVIAMLRVTERMIFAYDTYYDKSYPIAFSRGATVLVGNDLIRLVIANPSKAEIISQTLIERGTSGVSLLESVIRDDVQSLSRGIL